MYKYSFYGKSIPDELSTFHAVKETVRNWHEEIFNYFDYPYANVVTESVNNLIKSIEKAERGYTFEVIRAKMLFGTKATKKPIYRPKPKRNEGSIYYATFDSFICHNEVEIGSTVSIAELTEFLTVHDIS